MSAPAVVPLAKGYENSFPAPAEGGFSRELGALRLAREAEERAEREAERRRRRFELREVLWGVSTLPRVSRCGRVRRDRAAPVIVRRDERGVSLSNLTVCGSIHACPVCMAKIRARRAAEIDEALTAHFRAGGGVYFALFTLPHDDGDGLGRLHETVRYSYAAVLGGRAYVADREVFEIIGQIRAHEATHGPAGWHPHIHAVLLTERPLTLEEQGALHGRLYDRWAAAVKRRGHRVPWREFCGFSEARDVSDVAHYVAKVLADVDGAPRGLALELTRPDMKQGRAGKRSGTTAEHRTPWQILADVADRGAPRDVALWREWEQGSKGVRAISWSRGLKARFGIGEVSDEEIAAEERRTDLPPLAILSDVHVRALSAIPGAWAELYEIATGRSPLCRPEQLQAYVDAVRDLDAEQRAARAPRPFIRRPRDPGPEARLTA